MSFYKFTSVYIRGKLKIKAKTKVWASIEALVRKKIWVQKVAKVEMRLLLVEIPLASLFLLAKKRLQQVYRPTIWLAKCVNSKSKRFKLLFF